jgi:signal transduction protein with GAF and PtsI domain
MKKKTVKKMHREFSTGRIEALSKISSAITSDLYIEDILRLIVIVTAGMMQSKICSLMLLDEKRQEISIRATQSMSEEYNKKPPLKAGEGIVGKAIAHKKPVAVLDVGKEKEYKYRDIAIKEGLKSLLCVPMIVKGRVIGAINCYTQKPHKFTKTEIDMLTTVANQAAVAIENTELLVKTKVIQEELESRKIIEKAKGILMKQNGLSEDEAFRRIQKHSMDSRRSMREIAEAIILTEQMKT